MGKIEVKCSKCNVTQVVELEDVLGVENIPCIACNKENFLA